MSIFGAAKRGLGMLGKLGKKKPTPTPKPSRPKTAKEKHDEFMQKDPYERGAIISRRESAKRGDVYTGTSVVGTPSPHRSAKAIKKYSGPRSYQLTDPKRRGPHAKGGRIGLKTGGAFLPLRGTGGAGVAKAFRGKAGFKESQALQSKIVKGTPIRKEYADLKRAHHTKQRIKDARISREARSKVWKARKSLEANPFVKRSMSQSIHPKSWRRQTTKLLKKGKV